MKLVLNVVLGLCIALSMMAPLVQASAAEAVPAQASAIPFKQEAAVGTSQWTGGALGILVLSAAAIGVVLVLRKKLNLHVASSGVEGERHLRVLETQRLGPRTVLSVVEFAGARYLVAQSEQGVSCIASAPGLAGNTAAFQVSTQEAP